MELNLRTDETFNIEVSKTERYWVHTNHGKLLDTICGSMTYIYGYSNDYILDKMYKQQRQIAYLDFKHNEICESSNQLTKLLCDEGQFEGIGYAVSGSDGVECAIAMNNQYWKELKQNKTKIISFTPGYHGATFLNRSFRNEELGPAIVVERTTEKNTLEKVEYLLNNREDIGAVIMESIPWSNGINPWSKDWWHAIRELTNKHNVNLIIDDVMGGMGKLGHKFSHKQYDVQPDIVVLGKSLTGGYAPLSCACAVKRISDVISNNWAYGHTWQPNMAGVGAALAVWDLFDSSAVIAVSKRMESIASSLLDRDLIVDYSTIGLITSMKLTNPITSDTYLKNGLTGGPSIKHSITICTPLIADDEYFAELESRLVSCLTVI
jgi:adenosylmethionine-8-amino-7-oxononanoate aminotransferase